MCFFFYFFKCYMLCGSNHGDFFFYDARFLSGNFGKSVPEILHMIQSHIGDNRYDRRDHIGRVIATAHTDFHHGIVNLFFPEHPECHGCKNFKFRQRFSAFCGNFIGCLFYNGSGFCKIILGNIMSAKINAFRIINQVWRNKAAHP